MYLFTKIDISHTQRAETLHSIQRNCMKKWDNFFLHIFLLKNTRTRFCIGLGTNRRSKEFPSIESIYCTYLGALERNTLH